jgi:CRP-like cAMP-binding protein
MPDKDTSPLFVMLHKLERLAPLDDGDRDALLSLPFTLAEIERGRRILGDGEGSSNAHLLRSGVACRQTVLANGARQIVSLHLQGAILDLSSCVLSLDEPELRALTSCEIALIPREAIQGLLAERPATLGLAMWRRTLADAAILRAWMTNNARRDARSRLAHLLCELGLRLEGAGLGERTRYRLPMTQEQIADCIGLTPVHVNRVLKDMEKDRLISGTRGSIEIADWERLTGVGGFGSEYLYSGRKGGNGLPIG